MFNLVKNEIKKIFAKKSSWVLLIILFALLGLISWAVSATSGQAVSRDSILSANQSLSQFVIIFAVVIGSTAVTEEFSKNTIKILLTRPYSRSQILLSKFLAITVYALCLSAVMFLGGLLLALIFGRGDKGLLLTSSQHWQNLSPVLSTFYATINNFIVTMAFIAFIFILAGGFRSLGLAVTLGIGVIWIGAMGSSVLTGLILWKKLYWLRWNPLTQLYLNTRFGATAMPLASKIDVGYWPNLLTVIAYAVIFYVIADRIFSKRDISYS